MLVSRILLIANLISVGFGIAIFLGVNMNQFIPLLGNTIIQPIVGLAIVFLGVMGLWVHIRLLKEESDD